jgi:hypothetical protein
MYFHLSLLHNNYPTCCLAELHVSAAQNHHQVRYKQITALSQEPAGSVSAVSDYGLDDRVTRVQSPAGAKDFSSNLCVQTGSGAHPASCTMGTGGPFPGSKSGRAVTLTTHPHLQPRSRMSRSYTYSPLKRRHGLQRDFFALHFLANTLNKIVKLLIFAKTFFFFTFHCR